jgi:hypothetical protein
MHQDLAPTHAPSALRAHTLPPPKTPACAARDQKEREHLKAKQRVLELCPLVGGLPVVGGVPGVLNGLPVVGGVTGGAVGGVGGVTVTIGGVTVTGTPPLPVAPAPVGKAGKSKGGKGKQ